MPSSQKPHGKQVLKIRPAATVAGGKGVPEGCDWESCQMESQHLLTGNSSCEMQRANDFLLEAVIAILNHWWD
jgi:hypothetical protein